jgi:histone H3/H4
MGATAARRLLELELLGHCCYLPLQEYEAKAAAEKAAYNAAVAAQQPEPAAAAAAAVVTPPKDGSGSKDAGDADAAATLLPVARVKRIAKLAPDAADKSLGKEAAWLLTAATELFIEALGGEAEAVTVVCYYPSDKRSLIVSIARLQGEGRRTISSLDVARAIARNGRLAPFLRR